MAASCGGNAKYAGLTRDEATTLAKARIEAKLRPGKSGYYEVSIWNIAALHGESAPGTPAWLIGIWNGQSERGDCALASRVDGTTHVRLIACATFPKYAR
jgi:hypothetical protein